MNGASGARLPKKRKQELASTELWESVSVDRVTRERWRSFMPVAREPKKPRRGTLAREKTPPLQACCSKTLWAYRQHRVLVHLRRLLAARGAIPRGTKARTERGG